jgi:hypothetical protein
MRTWLPATYRIITLLAWLMFVWVSLTGRHDALAYVVAGVVLVDILVMTYQGIKPEIEKIRGLRRG